MTAAAAPTPAKPFGMNGDQLAGSTAKAPAAMKNSTTATLIVTITLVTRALSLIPSTSKPVKASTIRVAGKLMSPPSYGALVSSAGSGMPIRSSMLTKDPDQPRATAPQAIPYSSTRAQPVIQAKSSPMVAYA